jgi:hypothetical protein
MQYELECGHCGYQFVLEVAVLPRTTKCAVCGGVLAIVVPVPLAPPRAPPPPIPPRPALLPPALTPVVDEAPKPAPRPPVPPPAPADADTPGDWVRLAEPWRSVCFGLWLAHNGTAVAGALWAMAICVGAFIALLEPRGERAPLENLLWILLAVHLIPAALQLAGQLRCQAVSESYGRRLVTTSCVLSLLSCVLPCCLASAGGPALTAVVFVALNLVAFGFWLAFLKRLGRRLRADALMSAFDDFGMRFGFGVMALVAFLATAYRTAHVGSGLLWLSLTGAVVIGFFLLWQYSVLLRVATRAVVLRGTPLTPSA